MSVSVLLSELERCRVLGIPPDESELWRFAPDGIRAHYRGYLDAEAFWAQLRRWLEFRTEGEN